MSVLRAILLGLLVCALLPLGTFHRVYAAPVAAADRAQQADDRQTVAEGQRVAQAMAEAPRRCHGPLLPGSPCTFTLGLPPDPQTLPEPGRTADAEASDPPAARGHRPPPALGPPRLG